MKVVVKQAVALKSIGTRKGAEVVYGALLCCDRCGLPGGGLSGGTLVKLEKDRYRHQKKC